MSCRPLRSQRHATYLRHGDCRRIVNCRTKSFDVSIPTYWCSFESQTGAALIAVLGFYTERGQRNREREVGFGPARSLYTRGGGGSIYRQQRRRGKGNAQFSARAWNASLIGSSMSSTTTLLNAGESGFRRTKLNDDREGNRQCAWDRKGNM